MKKLWLVSLLMLTLFSCKTQKELKKEIKGTYSAQWEAIEEHIKKGFPEKAIEGLNLLMVEAKSNQDDIVATQALLQKVNLKNLDQDDFMEEKVGLLKEEIESTDDPISKSILNFSIAIIYQNYWETNLNLIDESSSGDEEWDGEKYSQFIDSLFTEALIAESKTTNIKEVSFLFSKAYDSTMTLWDFIMLEKIRVSKHNVYEKLLGDIVSKKRTEGLYDELIDKLIQSEQRRLALEIDIEKLKFLEKDLSALEESTPESLEYILLYHKALMQNMEAASAQSDKKKASQLLEESIDKLEKVSKSNDSIYVNNALAQIESIKKADLRIAVEKVYIPNQKGLIYIERKNLDRAYIKIYKLEKGDYLSQRREKGFPYRNKPIAYEGELEFPSNPNPYTFQSTEIEIPALQPGYYGVVVNTDESFRIDSNEPLYQSSFLVSNLAINAYYDDRSGKTFLECINRTTGERINGANFKIFNQRYNQKPTAILEGIGNPEFSFVPNQNNYAIPFVEFEDQYVMNSNGLYHNNYREQINFSAQIFTDRSIYRPGQTVHFKGVVIRRNLENVPALKGSVSLQFQFNDNMGNKIGNIDLKAKEDGSFNGSFEIPEDTQNGSVNINLSSKDIRLYSYSNVRVEEYKRPKFELTVVDIEQEIALDQPIKVEINAVSYTGVPVENAKVSYKVYRSYWIPYFYRRGFGGFPPSDEERVLIKSGIANTDQLGRSSLSFEALSPENPKSKNYTYTIDIQVLDSSGETQTISKTYNVSAQSVFIKFEETEKEGEYVISTVNSENKPIAANVSLKVYVDNEKEFKIERYWQFPDTSTVDSSEFANYSFLNKEEKFNELVYTSSIEAKDSVRVNFKDIIGAGSFKIVLNSGDDNEVSHLFEINDFSSASFGTKEAFYLEAVEDAYAPGDQMQFRIGSNIKALPLHILKYRNGKLVDEKWQSLSGVLRISENLSADDYGGFSYVVRTFYKNRIYDKTVNILVPWKHKTLTIKPKTIRYVTEPGAPEKWTFIVTDYEGKPVRSSFLSSMYDLSLDQFQPHSWQWNPYPTYLGTQYFRSSEYGNQYLYTSNYQWNRGKLSVLPFEIKPEFLYSPVQFGYARDRIMYRSVNKMMDAEAGMERMEAVQVEATNYSAPPPPPSPVETKEENDKGSQGGNVEAGKIRTNLSELVFFLPNLETNEAGEVEFEFENNEALTKWKLQNFAFTKDLKYGFSSEEIITRKELMIQANQPRFLRSGDRISLAAKLINLSGEEQQVTANLRVVDELSGQHLEFEARSQSVLLPKDGQKNIFWELNIPMEFRSAKLIYSVSGTNHEDAEQYIVPVLPNEIYLIDSETILLGATESKTVDVTKLLDKSKRSSALTIESTGSPAWYAMKALPYLVENDHENSEAIFNKYFANALALKIMEENPLVEKFYKEWEEKGNLKSQLSLNEALKAIDLNQTPWLKDAMSEEESMLRIAELFNKAKVRKELSDQFNKLKRMQKSDGGFPWFNGGRTNFYISQYILEGLLRMEDIGIGVDDRSLRNALYRYCTNEIVAYNHSSTDKVSQAMLKNLWFTSVIGQAENTAYTALANESLKKIKINWFEYGLQDQVYIAKIFTKDDRKLAEQIVASLLEKSFYKEQLGRFWNQNGNQVYSSWDIEFQASLISLFNLFEGYETAIDEMKFWLITNKRTHSWSSTIATSSAIYALTLGVSSSFAEALPINSSIDGVSLEAGGEVVGINYQKHVINEVEKIDKVKEVKFTNPNSNKAWANVHYQFFQDYDDVTRTENEFLDIKKEVYLIGRNDELMNIEDRELKLGDRLRVKLLIETDRPMEFVHARDDRPAGAEPVDQKSGYVWENRLSYYLSVKDVATHFFIDRLSKGKHVVEYELFVNNLGDFSAGVAQIQNYYAPEFNDYSKSIRVKVVE